jgi:aspartate/methionine/tyrosine aminotransferase
VFPPVPYLEWIEGRPGAARYDLGSSALAERASPADEVVPPALAESASAPSDATPREQVAAEYGVDEENVLVTAGATAANLLVATAAIDLASEEDDRPFDAPYRPPETVPQVLVEKPGYQPLVATPGSMPARVDRFRRSPDENHRLDPERVAAATEETLALASVTNRHNPSGRLTDRGTLAETARVVADRGGRLLVDEVYAPYVREAAASGADEPTAFGGVTAVGIPNVVVTSSLTKFHGLGGLRLGWLVGPPALVDRARSAARHLSAVAEPSRVLGARALADDALVARRRERLAENADRLATFVAERPALAGTVHDDATFALLTHERGDGDAVFEAAWDEGVLVVPGRFFDRPDAFRLSAGGPPDEVRDGLDVLGDVLDGL